MAKYIKGCGKMINLKVRVISKRDRASIKEGLKTVNSMDLECVNGLMVNNTKETII